MVGITCMDDAFEKNLENELRSRHQARGIPRPSKAKPNKRIRLAERYGWSCWWCGQRLREKYGFQNSATIEHLQCKSLGGTGEIWNLTAACARCNFARGTMHMDEFAPIARDWRPDTRLVEDARRSEQRARRRARHEERMRARQPVEPPMRWTQRLAARLHIRSIMLGWPSASIIPTNLTRVLSGA